MERMTLIAAALCLIMLTTVGAGVVAAKQTENPHQAGKSSIYFYDIQATDTHGKGALQINLEKHTFVFNGKGFDPDKSYLLQYRGESFRGTRVLAVAVASHSGNLHITGTWAKDAAPPTTVGFGASVAPNDPVTSTLSDYSQTDHYYVFAIPGGTYHLYGLPAGYVGDQAKVWIDHPDTTPQGEVFYYVHVQVFHNGIVASYNGEAVPVTS